MQTYGFYFADHGYSDLDIYTSTDESEYDPYGGLWDSNGNGPGVKYEIESVLCNAKLYVVPPAIEKSRNASSNSSSHTCR